MRAKSFNCFSNIFISLNKDFAFGLSHILGSLTFSFKLIKLEEI